MLRHEQADGAHVVQVRIAHHADVHLLVWARLPWKGRWHDRGSNARRHTYGAIRQRLGRLHRRTAENGIIDEEYRVEYVIDRTDTVGTAFLGLSVGCARCHDHKFDPISHADYYSLTAFFNSTDDAGFYPQEKWETGPTMYLTDDATDTRIAALRAERLAEARQARTSAAPAPAGHPEPAGKRPQRLDRQPEVAGLERRHAATRATGARRQARKDSR